MRLLENAVPLERVAKILGHKSVRVTERSYGPWVRALQETLEADVAGVWEGRKDRPKLALGRHRQDSREGLHPAARARRRRDVEAPARD